jgi:ABC-type transport system involved in multi-copper enzyme maturation permease subunit
MVCLPLIERELRVALRKQRPAQSRFKVAALAAGGSVLILLLGAVTGDRSLGRALEQFLCVASLYFVLQAPMLTAGVLAEERRNQTLGLLFLSGLGATEVFASKFLSSALVAFTNLLAIFPMLALPFLIGGVSFDLFLATLCALPALMLLALALSLLASVLTREDGAAVALAIVLGALLCALTPAIYLAQSHFSPGARLSLWWLRLSPAYGAHLVWSGFSSGFSPGQRAEFWQNLALTLGWSGSALGAAAFALKRLWREREVEQAGGGWRNRWRGFIHGGRESRRRLGRLWLDANPFVWLAARDCQPARLGWLVVGGIVLAWLSCWALWPARWPNVLNSFITAILLNSVLAWLNRHTAAQAIAQGRRDGAYELLLTTPLTPGHIVSGALEALRLHFRALANFVLLLNALLMLGGLTTRRWSVATLVVYFISWLFLLSWSWSLGRRISRVLLVMWVSLNCGRPAHSVWRISGLKSWYWVWIVIDVPILGPGFQRFPTGSRGELMFMSCLVLFWLIWLASHSSVRAVYVRDLKWDSEAAVGSDRLLTILSQPAGALKWDSEVVVGFEGGEGILGTRLIAEFREIVCEPLPDPSDPRFKKWNVRERFPSGRQ